MNLFLNVDISWIFLLIPLWFIIASIGLIFPMKNSHKYLVAAICMLNIFYGSGVAIENYIIYKKIFMNRNTIRQDIEEIKEKNYESYKEKVFIYDYLEKTYGETYYIYTGDSLKAFNLEIGDL